MPKKIEQKLKKAAKKKFPKNRKKQDAYVFGTMNKMGMMNGDQGMPITKKQMQKMIKKNHG